MMKTEDIEARLILSTKRKKRRFNLIDIAKDINLLIQSYGSLKGVSKKIGISEGMLRRFLKVDKLDNEVKELIKKRIIDSVTVVDNLTKFSKDEQKIIVKKIVKNKINTQDLRFLAPLRKRFPDKQISEIIDKLISSKDIKVSVIKFYNRDLIKGHDEFKTIIKDIVGAKNIINIDTDSIMCQIKLTKEGENRLRSKAKESNKNLKEYLITLLK